MDTKAEMPIQTQSRHPRGDRRRRACLLVGVLSVVSCAPVSRAVAQDAVPLTQLPNLNTDTSGARPELQRLLEQVEAQIADATARDDQEDIDRLIDLRGQLQVIQLQVELEDLQRQNTTMREQSSTSGAEAGGDGGGATSPGMAGMQDEVEALNDMQADTVKQLDDIAEQHAFLLEQLGHDMPGMGGMETQSDAPSTPSAGVSARLREVRALNARFKTLSEQQSQIEEVLTVVSEEHANLLAALGVAKPAQAGGTYTVQAGDSLSGIAKAVYGSGDRWPEIVRANPSLTDPSVLFVGTVLTIP